VSSEIVPRDSPMRISIREPAEKMAFGAERGASARVHALAKPLHKNSRRCIGPHLSSGLAILDWRR